ncbi:MAG: amidohydrolase [Epsilonproteobacteria bacterium]|nr:amidohydrolase [Campylobacterota bacterium]
MGLIETIEKLKDEFVNIRRHIHEYPDLSGEEYPTRDFVLSKLEKRVDKIKTFNDFAGAVVDIVVDENLPTVAFRADMDALPIKEENEVPYRSKKDGIMHACGHDAHTAILCGFLMAASENRDELKVNIRGIFQHKEEVMEGGSEDLIKKGALEGVEAIFATHVYPYLNLGEIGYKYGEMMASADMFKMEIFGKSAHGARPHEGVDAILTASMAVNSINHIVSRRIDPLHPAVISFGKIEGGKAANIISDYVELEGTVRTLNDGVRQGIKEMMKDALDGICKAMGAEYNFEYLFGNPELINDDKMVDLLIKAASPVAKPVDLKTPVMGGEDFANYLKVVKGAFFRLGSCGRLGSCYPQHHPKFDIDEECLLIGAKIFANILKEF